LKDKIYKCDHQTEELKENIHREIADIPAVQLLRINQTSSTGVRYVYM
jgi:hypothetical protein